jgi:hypothetical protein
MKHYENAINGLAPGMNLDARKGTIPRVESNLSRTGPLIIGEVLPENGNVQRAETKDIPTIHGFGDVTFYTLNLILDVRSPGRIQLKDTEGNNLTSCSEILARNKQLVNEYNSQKEDENQGTIVGYDLADNDELEYNGIQEVYEEIFGHDVGKKPTKVAVAKLLNRLDIKREL